MFAATLDGRATRAWGGAVVLALVTAGAAVAVAYASGAMHTAYGDDWSYSRVAFHLYETGHLRLNGWEGMTLVAHLVWAYPFMAAFGPSLAVLHWATAVAAVIGLLATFAVLRRFLAPGAALFGTAVIAILPSYGVLVTTYMTDIPAFAAVMVCLELGLAALDADRARRWVLLAASLAIGMAGFAAREIAIAAPAAVLGAHLVSARRRGAPMWRLVVPPVALLVAAGAFLEWRHGLPGHLDPEGTGPTLGSISALAQGYFTLALGLLPAVVAGLWTARGGQSHLAVAGFAAAVALAAVVGLHELRHHEALELPLGDLYGRSWRLPGGEAPADSPAAFLPGAVWVAIDVLALVAGALLTVLIASAARERLGAPRLRATWDLGSLVLALFALFYSVPLVIRALQGLPLFDRYFWPLTVPLLVLSLRGLSAAPPRLALATAALLAVLTVVAVVHETAVRGAQWKTGDRAVAGGSPVRNVDAGFAWVGYHATGHVGSGPASPRWSEPEPFYASLFPAAGNCLSTSLVPLSDSRLRLVSIQRYRWIPGMAKIRVWLYRSRQPAPGCV
jgi:hypothetical protein